MSKVVLLSRVILGMAAMVALHVQASAAEPPAAAQPAQPSQPKPGFQCNDKALTGSGPGFKDSQDESEAAAKQDWLGKAQAVYGDADLTSAKDVSWECVKQGLYIKCFLTAVPCHPKPAEHGNAAP